MKLTRTRWKFRRNDNELEMSFTLCWNVSRRGPEDHR
jgi:hypothetical protein